MTKQQKTDLRVMVCGTVGIVLILPWVEWHEVRPSALASVAIMVGCWCGVAIAAAVWSHDDQR